MRLFSLLALALVVATGAAAGVPQHPNQRHYAIITALLGSQPQILRTKQIVPDVASARVDGWVNGHRLPYGGADSSRIIEMAGRGVIVVASVSRKSAPAAVRLASARGDTVRVRVVFSWR